MNGPIWNPLKTSIELLKTLYTSFKLKWLSLDFGSDIYDKVNNLNVAEFNLNFGVALLKILP